MIDINDLYNDFKALVNTFQGGFFPPNVFSLAVSNISLELWNKYTSEAERSQEAKDYLLPFLKGKNIITTTGTTFYNMLYAPDNYGRFAGSKIILSSSDAGSKTIADKNLDSGKIYKCECGKEDQEITDSDSEAADYKSSLVEVDIDNVDTQRWASCLNHLYKKPTFQKPKMTQSDGGWKVAPNSISVVVLYYFIMPKEVKLLYTTTDENLETGDGGDFIYDSKNSISLEWNLNIKPEFLWRLGERFGVYTRDQFMSTISTNNKVNPD